MPKAGQGKDGGVVVVLLTENCDEQEVRAFCDRVSHELGTIVMEWLKQPAPMRRSD
jgi:signal transduction histidine kinase